MKAGQLVVRGSRRAPTPPPDGPAGSPESARPRVSFLSLSFRGAAPLAALITSFRSCFWCSNGAMCSNHQPLEDLVGGEPAQKAVAALRMRGVRVLLRHVRAHRGHAMNERADTLAGLGAQGVRMRDGRPFDPPDYPDPSHARSATPVHSLLPPDTVPD